MSLKIFLTEFRFRGTIHEGPNIVAESFEDAEEQAEEYKEYQNGGEYPEWVDEIDWDEGEKTWRDGNTSVVHVEVIEED